MLGWKAYSDDFHTSSNHRFVDSNEFCFLSVQVESDEDVIRLRGLNEFKVRRLCKPESGHVSGFVAEALQDEAQVLVDVLIQKKADHSLSSRHVQPALSGQAFELDCLGYLLCRQMIDIPEGRFGKIAVNQGRNEPSFDASSANHRVARQYEWIHRYEGLEVAQLAQHAFLRNL